MLEWKFPELADLERPRDVGQWQQLAAAMRHWAAQVAVYEIGKKREELPARLDKIKQPPTAEQLQTARADLPHIGGLSAEQVQVMSDAEVEVRFTVARFHEIADEWRRWFYVAARQALPAFPRVIETLKVEGKRRELYPLVSLIVPVDANLVATASRCDRLRARLQTIEAVRMHAAVAGMLPANLAEVTVVPIPADPATGEPLRYSLDGDVATIDVAEELGAPLARCGCLRGSACVANSSPSHDPVRCHAVAVPST